MSFVRLWIRKRNPSWYNRQNVFHIQFLELEMVEKTHFQEGRQSRWGKHHATGSITTVTSGTNGMPTTSFALPVIPSCTSAHLEEWHRHPRFIKYIWHSMTFSEGHINKAKPLGKHEVNPIQQLLETVGKNPLSFFLSNLRKNKFCSRMREWWQSNGWTWQ